MKAVPRLQLIKILLLLEILESTVPDIDKCVACGVSDTPCPRVKCARSAGTSSLPSLECVTNITITGLGPYLIIVIFASTFESLVPASRSTLLLEHLGIRGCKMEQGNRDCELARKKEAR